MERLLVFPQPFPDESLYSLTVRYHRMMANDSYRLTSQELFGTYSRTCGSILPCCLDALSKRLAGLYSVAELIDRSTLLPLYQPFLDDAAYESAKVTMAGNRGTGLKMSLGITASRFLKHASFRYCESCLHEDSERFGVAYWHRIHLSPGTCVCPHHDEVLCSLTFPHGSDWRCMLLPGESGGTPVMESYGDKAAGTVAEMQLWGLEHPSSVRGLLNGDFLRHRLAELGFIKSGRISEKILRPFLIERLKHCPNINEFQEVTHSCDWVLRMLHPRGLIVQPLKFYLLCWLLEARLSELQSFHPPAEVGNAYVPRRNNMNKTLHDADLEAHRSAFLSDSNSKCHDKPHYHWLYRHDREWLKEYVISHPFMRSRKSLIDWEARDTALTYNLLIANEKIMSTSGKPQKITRSLLVRQIDQSHDFLRRPSKFPKSISLMNGLLESDHDHQIRKVRWAVKNFLLSERCATSVVLRYSGIRKPHVTETEILNILSTTKLSW
ncbi:TnsD family Tn7-like transposition protein [Pseudomonas mandelii]|uniref:TnsD family Tn7-like transposition protein n=1 Tax=Pseudomonas mandelii TaxID=75612 RepID=UPI00224A777B|nr:TnsD family Tn7-like transposition protein [Pseudomonas mandelii]MCX2901468.1 TnsD family Tn7-like transposition protein [Pseudomonas mandelii]